MGGFAGLTLCSPADLPLGAKQKNSFNSAVPLGQGDTQGALQKTLTQVLFLTKDTPKPREVTKVHPRMARGNQTFSKHLAIFVIFIRGPRPQMLLLCISSPGSTQGGLQRKFVLLLKVASSEGLRALCVCARSLPGPSQTQGSMRYEILGTHSESALNLRAEAGCRSHSGHAGGRQGTSC